LLGQFEFRNKKETKAPSTGTAKNGSEFPELVLIQRGGRLLFAFCWQAKSLHLQQLEKVVICSFLR